MKGLIIVSGLLLVSCVSKAQFTNDFSAGLESTVTFYQDDDKIINPGDTKVRSNNYLQFNYYKNGFGASVQLESYLEEALLGYDPEFDKKLGLSMFSASYSHKKWRVSAGYLFDQFSSGLIFRTWEDRQLGLNNALIGMTFSFQSGDKIKLKAFAGKQKIGFDISNGVLVGMNANMSLSNSFEVDFGIVSRYEEFESNNPEFNEFTNLYTTKLKYHKNQFYGQMEYVLKSKDALVEFGNVIDNRLFSGRALYLNIGFFTSGFGFDLTVRRLENMAFYTDRKHYANIYNQLIVNHIPALTKQHNSLLSNIYVYQAQAQLSFLYGGKAGEIGQQIDVYYKFSKKNSLLHKYNTVVSANLATWYGLEAKYDLEDRQYQSEFLGFGEKYYTDLNLELKNTWTDQWRTSLFWMQQFYNKAVLEESTGTVNSQIAAVDIYYTINTNNELRLQAEHLWTQDDQKNWVGGIVEYNFLRKFSVYVNDQYNYGNENSQDRLHYYNVGGSFRHRKTKLGVNYGRQRGGLICVGGVCRFVPKSNGLTFSLNVYL